MTEVLKTVDYFKFHNLVGNREVNKRAEEIKESIKKIGWISNPIIVNEKYEIIDGQSRFHALKELAMPIEYKVIPNLDLDDCRTLNRYNHSWITKDYIDSYVAEGNPNYIRLKNLADTFKVKQIRLIIRASGQAENRENMVNGRLIFTEEQFGKAWKRLSLYTKMEPILKRFAGKNLVKAPAIFYIADRDDINFDELKSILENCNPAVIYTDTVVHFLESIQNVYNKNKMKKNRIHIAEDYRKERL